MDLPMEGYLLRIFMGESDKKEGLPLYEWLVRRAKQEKLAGVTVLRGIEGFGAKKHIHTARILEISSDLPIIIEIIDSKEKIENFMQVVEENLADGLATLEKVQIRYYKSSP